ncbi:hypothetical protein [Ensifer sp. B1-9]|uniref:hypothetical protein n=1 Tax=Ensifer sp. B1-9 TaxID=3141455 RepID=UPI003D1E9A85
MDLSHMAPSMRIVKLSRSEFPDLKNARSFFLSELPARKPPGKFCVTEARISRSSGLATDDYLVFTFNRRIIFTARSDSRLQLNAGEHRETHPWCFTVKLATLSETDVEIEALEHKCIQLGMKPTNVASSQGWNRLPASPQVDDLWMWLRE